MAEFRDAAFCPRVILETTIAGGRCYVFGASLAPQLTTAGGDVDGAVDGRSPGGVRSTEAGVPASPGIPVVLEADASFSSGASLEVAANGRVKAQSTGKTIARALESAAGAGSLVLCVWASGR